MELGAIWLQPDGPFSFFLLLSPCPPFSIEKLTFPAKFQLLGRQSVGHLPFALFARFVATGI
jgi:hypothetical protein